MGPIGDRIFVIVILGGLAAWVIWGWRSWMRGRPSKLTLGMMSTLIGFVCASISASLEIGTGVYAQVRNGFAFMDPTLLRIYAAGLILSVLGLVCGIFGADDKTPLRWKTPALSAV